VAIGKAAIIEGTRHAAETEEVPTAADPQAEGHTGNATTATVVGRLVGGHVLEDHPDEALTVGHHRTAVPDLALATKGHVAEVRSPILAHPSDGDQRAVIGRSLERYHLQSRKSCSCARTEREYSAHASRSLAVSIRTMRPTDACFPSLSWWRAVDQQTVWDQRALDTTEG
jgi:hypothetical protein